MISRRDVYDSESCPVREELLGEMYRASEQGLPMLVESVAPNVRAMLALFCYRRSHLHSLALAIAATGVWRQWRSIADRRRLKDILEDLDIPEGMGVIVRTAGAERSKADVELAVASCATSMTRRGSRRGSCR